MEFRTKIQIKESTSKISHRSNLVLMGSCFAENIGEIFERYKFNVSVNCFGNIFNPHSITNLVDRAINERFFTEKDIFFNNHQWHCYEVHSTLSEEDKDIYINKLNNLLVKYKNDLQNADYVIFTYGTSWVYRHIDSDKIVANCFKMPQKLFSKEILGFETIKETILKSENLIRSLNNNVKIIYTISPVRHIKEGFEENQRSKSMLIASIHEVLNNNCYFPSYEIVMDELRDYRFYEADMLHPNQIAIDYIWQRFSDTFFTENTKNMIKELEKLLKFIAHKPLTNNPTLLCSLEKDKINAIEKFNKLIINFK